MDDFVIVNVLEPEADLNKPLKDLILFERHSSFPLVTDPRLQIATFRVLHNDADIFVFIKKALTVGDHVLVTQRLHHFDLPQNILFLL